METIQEQGPKRGSAPDAQWVCPVCGDVVEYFAEQAAEVGFYIVHHLAHKHDRTRSQVLAYDPKLRDATDEYIGFPKDRNGKPMP